MDHYLRLANIEPVKRVFNSAGLPIPIPLVRRQGISHVLEGNCLLGSSRGGYAMNNVTKTIRGNSGLFLFRSEAFSFWSNAGQVQGWSFGDFAEHIDCAIYDATGITTPEHLRSIWAFFKSCLRYIAPHAKIVILAQPLDHTLSASTYCAQSAIDGLTRSLAKELKNAATLQCLRIARSSTPHLKATLNYFLSPASAYVHGQTLTLSVTANPQPYQPGKPFEGKTVLITGAAGSIGSTTAQLFDQLGASIYGIDHPKLEKKLTEILIPLGGIPLSVDLNQPSSVDQLLKSLESERTSFDIVIHNAGCTRDTTLVKMNKRQWDDVMNVNLSAPLHITEWMLSQDMIRPNGRVILLASVSGIAGNFGQTNYSTAKAGLSGLVQYFDQRLEETGITINGVAPGFIDTPMTAATPTAVREIARRLNTLKQGGLPIDVAEAIAWFAHPHSQGITGQLLRVCGQSILGA